jgi:peroxiredoxin
MKRVATILVIVASVVIGVVVVVLLATRSTSGPIPPALEVVSDSSAPTALVDAANAVGFHPTREVGAGAIESEPVADARPPKTQSLLPVGTMAPNFTLETPQGERVSLAQYRGKVLLLEFFTTRDPRCNAEAPHLQQIYESLPKGIYGLLSVNADGETAPSVFAFHRYYALQYPALIDPSPHPGTFNTQGSAGYATRSFRVKVLPAFYVIDPLGRVAWQSNGEQPDTLLKQELRLATAHD